MTEKTVYKLVRSRRKTLAMYVRPSGIEVRSPFHVSSADIDRWVRNKAGWIEKQQQDIHRQSLEMPLIEDGGHCLYLGERRQVLVQRASGKRSTVTLQGPVLAIRLREGACAREVFARWLQVRAADFIRLRCMKLSREMALQHLVGDIRFRKTRSKWGHCTQAGDLQFNWLIMMAPVDVIDYVIVHELSHLRHMDHSSRFWQLVSDVLPDYRTPKKWLRENGHQLMI